MKKLKAFTLIELVIAIVLSGFVMGMGSAGYLIMSKQFRNYKSINDNVSDAAELFSVLQCDIQQAKEVIKKSGSAIETSLKNRNVKYSFEKKYIVRNTGLVRDTFFVSTLNLETSFKNNKQELSEGLIDELSFNVGDKEQMFQFHSIKQYGADVLLANCKPNSQ